MVWVTAPFHVEQRGEEWAVINTHGDIVATGFSNYDEAIEFMQVRDMPIAEGAEDRPSTWAEREGEATPHDAEREDAQETIAEAAAEEATETAEEATEVAGEVEEAVSVAEDAVEEGDFDARVKRVVIATLEEVAQQSEQAAAEAQAGAEVAEDAAEVAEETDGRAETETAAAVAEGAAEATEDASERVLPDRRPAAHGFWR